MAPRPLIELQLTLDGEPVASETSYTWAGAHVLVLHTVIPRPGLALELHSTFIGQRGVATLAVHLALGPPGRAPAIETAEHPHEELSPTFTPRACAYEHAHQLVDLLAELGLAAGVNVPGEWSFQALERVEQP